MPIFRRGNFLKRGRSFQQKRAFCRLHCRNLVRQEPEASFITNLVDISEGGLQLTLDFHPQPGALFDLTINLTELGSDLTVLARVMWVKPLLKLRNCYRVGVRFEKMNDKDRQKVRQLSDFFFSKD